MRVDIAGSAVLSPEHEIVAPLDEMIYRVTAGALADAGLSIGQLSGVCMASSDLNDGRAISTMTLTGSTGSVGRTEMRVCNDGLAALWLGAAEVACGTAEVLMVCSWNKASDVHDPTVIAPLALEPTVHRGLAYHPDAVLGLRRSAEAGAPVVTAGSGRRPHDAACALILTGPGRVASPPAAVIATGASTGEYLRPGLPVLRPLGDAARSALGTGGSAPHELAGVLVAGLHDIDDGALAAELGVQHDRLHRAPGQFTDAGYTTGLLAATTAVRERAPGLHLAVTASGLGLENAHAVLLEVV